MKHGDGGQAFACAAENGHDPGMSQREYYAGQALAAMVIPPDYSTGPHNSAIAERAFAIADEMLLEGRKP